MLTISRVVYAVICWHVGDFKRIYTFQTPNVVAVFIRVRPALMMCVDATNRTEKMLCGVGVELIELENVMPFNNFYP
jgi:hypothetical protein